MARTFTYDVTVANISGAIYGFDNTGAKIGDMVETTDPFTDPPEYRAIGNDTAEGDGTGKQSRIFSFAVYATGIEAFTNEEAAPNDIYDGVEITEIRIAHSGGTKTLTSATWAGSAGTGFIYLWYPDTDVIWGAGDVGLTYSVEIDTNAAPAGPVGIPDTIITNPNNPGGKILPAAPRTTTTTLEVRGDPRPAGGTGSTGGGKGSGGGEVIVDLPPQAGTFSLDVFIEGYDFGSSTWYTILAAATIVAGTTTRRLKVAPYINNVANISANDLLPYMWRVRIEHNDATEVTYSAEYRLY